MDILTIYLIYFLAAATPGPSQVFILERAMLRSRSEARWGALGVTVGSFFWVALVAWGLGAFIKHHPWVSVYLSCLCVGLLFYFGARNVQMLLKHRDPKVAELHRVAPTSPMVSLMQGVLVNLLNPGSVVFFMTLFAPLITQGMSSSKVNCAVVGVVLISLAWYQLIAELSRVRRLQMFLQRQATPLRVAITVFYFYWGLKMFWALIPALLT